MIPVAAVANDDDVVTLADVTTLLAPAAAWSLRAVGIMISLATTISLLLLTKPLLRLPLELFTLNVAVVVAAVSVADVVPLLRLPPLPLPSMGVLFNLLVTVSDEFMNKPELRDKFVGGGGGMFDEGTFAVVAEAVFIVDDAINDEATCEAGDVVFLNVEEDEEEAFCKATDEVFCNVEEDVATATAAEATDDVFDVA